MIATAKQKPSILEYLVSGILTLAFLVWFFSSDTETPKAQAEIPPVAEAPTIAKIEPLVVEQLRTGETPYLGCYEKSDLDLVVRFSVERNEQGIRALHSQDRCHFVPTERDVTKLDSTWTGSVKIMVHLTDGSTLTTWTVKEALQ